VGAENSVMSCDLDIFVDEAAEPVSSEYAVPAPERGGVPLWAGAGPGIGAGGGY